MAYTKPETQKKYYRKKRKAGICIRCLNPVDGSTLYCAEHKEWNKLRMQSYEAKRKASGLPPRKR